MITTESDILCGGYSADKAADDRFFVAVEEPTSHILTAQQFDLRQLERLFDRADKLRLESQDPVGRRELAGRYLGHQMCSLFYEPSTRTRLSFEQSAAKMGIAVVSTENAREFSSASKGETIEDTIQVLNEYDFGVIVLRHDVTGSAARAAAVSEVPIINAGDGKGEHPTQALLDAYTIMRKHGRLDNLNIVMGGDLKHGRTVRSLAQLLAKCGVGNHISFVSVPELQIGEDIKTYLTQQNTTYCEASDMYEALSGADVVYWTRLQKERLENPSAVPDGGYVIDEKTLAVMSAQAVIMHPLPRVDEIHPSVDSDPRAAYFEQAGHGLYVRMALIDKILSAA